MHFALEGIFCDLELSLVLRECKSTLREISDDRQDFYLIFQKQFSNQNVKKAR